MDRKTENKRNNFLFLLPYTPWILCNTFCFLSNMLKINFLLECFVGYRNLTPDVEEGICQVLAHMWLDSEIAAGSGSSVASSSESSSSSSSSSTSSKKGKRSQFEKKLGEFFKHQIESDTSAAYGQGFREGNQAVLKYGLKRTLDHIRLTERFP